MGKLEVFTATTDARLRLSSAACVQVQEKLGPIHTIRGGVAMRDPRCPQLCKSLEDTEPFLYEGWDDQHKNVIVGIAREGGRYAIAWPEGSNCKGTARRLRPTRVAGPLSVPTDLLAPVRAYADRSDVSDEDVVRSAIELFLKGRA